MFFSAWNKTTCKRDSVWNIPALLALSLLLISCKEQLDPLSKAVEGVHNYATLDASFCTNDPKPAQQKLKYLFIIDHSGSNQATLPSHPSDISDSDSRGSRRYGPMVDFINRLVPDANTPTSFALINFNDLAEDPFPSPTNSFETDTQTFITKAQNVWIGGGDELNPEPVDKGFTNYQAALALAKETIEKDAGFEAINPDSAGISTVYQIIFVSDGIPVIEGEGVGQLYTQTFELDIEPVITSMMDLKSHPVFGKSIANISLNTAYYFNSVEVPEAGAVSLLESMSERGNGLFIQFGSGQQILYQQFAPPVRNIINQLADVFIENTSAVWWDDGRFLLDTDSDGLPDDLEIKLGANPQAKDSDGNGVSDLVEYRTKGKACDEATCLPLGRDPYSICAGHSPTIDGAGNTIFAATANDGLNDCEKFLLNGKSTSFNSSGNLLPDLFAFKNALSIQKGSNNVALADPYGDGINNYGKLKLGLPLQTSLKTLINFEQRKINLAVVSTKPNGVICYRMTADKIALSGKLNKLKVYVIQNSSLIQDKPFMISAEKGLDSNLRATFTELDFK